jgi:hypothetical protein
MCVCVAIFLAGCHTREFISRGEIEAHPDYPISIVITTDGEVYEFKPNAILKDSVIVGTLMDGTFVEIPVARVNMVYAKRFDQSRSGAAFLCGTGTTVLVATIAILGVGALVLFIWLVGAAASM